MKKELSVVMPAFNEERRVGSTLREVAVFLSRRGYDFEILVVNDGSKDGTAREAAEAAREHPQIRVLDEKVNRGKGQAVRFGIEKARFPLCLFMDADNATSIAEWDAFEKHFENGAPAVIASRHLPESRIVHPQPAVRRILGAGYRALSRMVFGLRASDFNCGFKAYRTDLAKRIFSDVRMRDWTFDVEAFYIMKKEGVPFEEVPVRWNHKEKPSGIAPVRTALKSLWSLARLRCRLWADPVPRGGVR